ncbi:MAG TPA: PIN domain-containing protein [Methylomirabilota bacterium]
MLVSAATVGGTLALALHLPVPLLVLAGFAAGSAALAVEAAGALRREHPPSDSPATPSPRAKLVDSSVLIDGRIADLAATGFLEGRLLVPQFVLRELQRLADVGDAQKRSRGRRGFEVLKRLQGVDGVTVEIVDDDVGEGEVDLKLIEVARRRHGVLLTTDYNLNRLGDISGIMVLNVNDLAHALKPAVLPGAVLRVHVLREGKEAGQGVGFLEDGTMVVVDQGRPLVGQEVSVVVTSALQTSAGRMIFGQVRGESGEGDGRAG